MTTRTAVGYGLGRRKEAVARAWLTEDVAQRVVNGQPWDDYFTTVAMRAAVRRPLELTSTEETYGVTVTVMGGGKRGQAGAVQLAVARALENVNPAWRKQLKESGMLSRDARVKERKKYGLKRARRAPQFSKR